MGGGLNRGKKDIERKRRDTEGVDQEKNRMEGPRLMKGEQPMIFQNKKENFKTHWVTPANFSGVLKRRKR